MLPDTIDVLVNAEVVPKPIPAFALKGIKRGIIGLKLAKSVYIPHPVKLHAGFCAAVDAWIADPSETVTRTDKLFD